MNFWSDLTSAALLGTGRGFIPVALPGQLNELLADSEAEECLLRTAGILATAQLAALTVNPSVEPVPIPAEPESAVPLTASADVALFARIIDKGQIPLLIEACYLLANAGHCLPPRLLPRALELGRQSTVLRDALRRALGQRGIWLATQNPDWKFAALADVEPADPRLWDEGDIRQRAAFLRHLRTTDPAEARRLLETTVTAETARDRAVLLPSLGEHLGMDDEPFLATTLANDRSKEVRVIAAALLSQLPNSDFAQRMMARLEPCIRNERKRLRTVTVIEPPLTFVPEWKTDALEEQPPAQVKFGERAWWLCQMVSSTPLAWWEIKLALDPDSIVALMAKSEWKAALLAGLRIAITRQPGQTAWATALLKHGGFAHQEALQLALTLAPADADTVLQPLLATTSDVSLVAQLIESADFPWSIALWHIAQEQLPLWLSAQDWRFYRALPQLAYRIPPSALDDVVIWPEKTQCADAIAQFSAILRERRALHQRFLA